MTDPVVANPHKKMLFHKGHRLSKFVIDSSRGTSVFCCSHALPQPVQNVDVAVTCLDVEVKTGWAHARLRPMERGTPDVGTMRFVATRCRSPTRMME